MKAVKAYAPKDYRLEVVDVPTAGPGEVVVRVLSAGICGSDIKTYHGARVWGSDEIAPYIETPVTPGHEFVGQVVDLGPGAAEKHDLRIGQMAVSEQIVPCHQCRFCKRDEYWMCQQHDIYGFKRGRAEGAWAEYMRFPQNAINHQVPGSIDPSYAALIEPLACAIHAVERGQIRLGDVTVIAGMGPIGLCMLQVARLKSPGLLVALDLKEQRLKAAEELGADLAINVKACDVVSEVLALTEGYGCDVYIEAAGAGSAVSQGLQMLRRLGTFVEFGVHAGPVSIDWSVIGDEKELNIHGSHLGPYSYPLAIDYLANGVIAAEKIVTHRLPLEHYNEGLDLAAKGEESIKVILVP